MAKHLEVGKQGENIALQYLESKNYKILETNWRYRRSEVDIITMDGEVLVFIEVKTRSSDIWGQPELSVTAQKETMLIDASSAYMEQIGHVWEIRFDIITVILNSHGSPKLNHYKDAFFPGF